MNAEAAGLIRQKVAAGQGCDREALTKQILKNLKIKTVVRVSFPLWHGASRQNMSTELSNWDVFFVDCDCVMQESHCTPVGSLVLNRLQAAYHNLFATVGKNQVLFAAHM